MFITRLSNNARTIRSAAHYAATKTNEQVFRVVDDMALELLLSNGSAAPLCAARDVAM
jgi:hypothetical protein